MKRFAALMLAASVNVGFAVSAQAAAPAAVTPPAAAVATSAANPTPPPSESPGAQLQRPGPVSPNAVTPKVPTLQGTWRWQNPLPDGNPLHAISCPSPSVCFAGSSDGRIRATIDGGSTWAVQATGISTSLNGISCADATHCVAVGDYGQALHTSDGISWGSVAVNSGHFLAGVSCAAALTCVAVGYAGSVLTTSDGVSWTAPSSGTTSNLFGVSCPSTLICYAVGFGGVVVGTANGGSTWSIETSPANPGMSLIAVSCSSTSICAAVGQGGVVQTTVGGGFWNPANAGLNVTLAGVSCPSANECFAGGTDGSIYTGVISSTYNWGRASTAETGVLYAVSCPTASVCFASGDFGMVVTTSSGGTGWTQPNSSTSLYGVSCPSATDCTAVGFNGQVYYTTNGGTSWTAQGTGLATATSLLAVTCPAATACFAVGGGGTVVKSSGAGTAWTAESTGMSSRGLSAISCPSVSACFATTPDGWEIATTDGGTTWTTPYFLTPGGLSAISCPTTSMCFVTDNSAPGNIYATTNGGSTWFLNFSLASDPNAGSTGSFDSIFCADSLTCFAAGTGGLVATTTDGGLTWRSDFTNTSAHLTGISCPSRGTCFISGYSSTVIHTTDFGDIWDVQLAGPFSLPGYSAISCSSTTTCVAVGTMISVTTNGGAAFTRPLPNGSTSLVEGMSCYGSSNCYAAAEDTLFATHDGGATWMTHTLVTTDSVVAISCPGINTCFAVGWPGAIYRTTDGGTSWIPQANILSGSDETLTGVSCASATTCVAVGNQGKMLFTVDGLNWNVQALGLTTDLWGVSCPSTNSCVAVGSGGLTLANTGTTWNAYPSGTTQTLTGVNCPTTNTCYAVGRAGTIIVTTNYGLTWSAQSSGTTVYLHGIACTQPTFCVADGDFGVAVATVDGGTWKALAPPTGNALRAVAFPDLNHAWLAGFGGTILANNSLIPSCTSVSVTPDKTSPQVLGTMVTLTAASAGCPHPNPQYRFYLRSPEGVWSIVQDFGSSTNFVWNTTTYETGTYLIGVWVRDSASGFTYDAYAFGTFTLQRPPCSSTNLSPDLASPQPATTTITFTASAAGCPNPLFQWWVRDPAGNWSIAVPFAAGNTFAWNTSSLNDGTYQIGVWAKQQLSPASYEAFAFVTYTLTVAHCTAVNLTTSVASPQVTTSSITLTPAAIGCPGAQYRFYVRDAGGTWHIQQDFGVAATYVWNSSSTPVNTTAAGTFLLGVWARQPGSANSYDAFAFITFSLTSGTTCTVNIAANQVSPEALGATVTWTATPTNCPATPLQYQFWVNPPGGTWGIVQPFGSSSTYVWTGPAVGTYQVGVWVKQAGSTSSYDNFAFTTFTLMPVTAPMVCGSVGVTSDVTSPQLIGSTVHFTATANGCLIPVYQWWVRDTSANWSIAQSYGNTSPSFAWNTAGLLPGTYLVGVWADGTRPTTTSSYDAYSFITYTLTVPAPQVCSSVNIAPDLASPRAPGTTVTFTAIALGCNNAEYRFFVAPPGGTFTEVQAYNSTGTFVWNTSGSSPGPWQIGVWVRQSGSTAGYEAFAFITFQLSFG